MTSQFDQSQCEYLHVDTNARTPLKSSNDDGMGCCSHGLNSQHLTMKKIPPLNGAGVSPMQHNGASFNGGKATDLSTVHDGFRHGTTSSLISHGAKNNWSNKVVTSQVRPPCNNGICPDGATHSGPCCHAFSNNSGNQFDRQKTDKMATNRLGLSTLSGTYINNNTLGTNKIHGVPYNYTRNVTRGTNFGDSSSVAVNSFWVPNGTCNYGTCCNTPKYNGVHNHTTYVGNSNHEASNILHVPNQDACGSCMYNTTIKHKVAKQSSHDGEATDGDTSLHDALYDGTLYHAPHRNYPPQSRPDIYSPSSRTINEIPRYLDDTFHQQRASYTSLTQDDGAEQGSNYSSQHVVTFLHDLLAKSEAVQNVLHTKLKDAYIIIQDETEKLFKSESGMKVLKNDIKHYKTLCQILDTKIELLDTENEKLVTINKSYLENQDNLQKRIVELYNDMESIWAVHKALQAENTEKYIIIEKTLNQDLQAFDNERTILKEEHELMSAKVVELEKYIEDTNEKLGATEKESTCLCSANKQLTEERSNFVEAEQQLKAELLVCQQLCEKLIVEKSHLIQRQSKIRAEENKSTDNKDTLDSNDQDCNNNTSSETNLVGNLSSLPFLKDVNENDIVQKIQEYAESLEKQGVTYKEDLESHQRMIAEIKERNNKLQSENDDLQRERNKYTKEIKVVVDQLSVLKKEQAEWKVEQSELTLIITENEMAKKKLEETMTEKDNEICVLQKDTLEKLLDSENTINLLQKHLETLESEIRSLKGNATAESSVVQTKSNETQTALLFKPRRLRRRHSEGCIKFTSCISGKHDLSLNEILELEKVNFGLSQKLEDAEKQRHEVQKELEDIVKHFQEVFDEQITKVLEEERLTNEKEGKKLLSELEKQKKECHERKEHLALVSKAYQKLQGEYEILWQEREATARKCESLEFERNQLREQIEELCRNHSGDEFKKPDVPLPIKKSNTQKAKPQLAPKDSSIVR